MTEFSMTIGGEAVTSRRSFGVANPATEEVFAEAPECSPDQLDAAMAAAQGALPAWSRDPARRNELLLQAAERFDAIAGELNPLLTSEQGKPLSDSAFETSLPGRWLRFCAQVDLQPEVVQEDDVFVARLYRHPVGVVAGISSWNFPLYQAFEKIAPALAAGNTIVLKSSPFTPLTTLVAGRVLGELLPPGVVNVISGGDEIGRLMTTHRTPRMLSFTGSIGTGENVAAAAVHGLKRLKLELGGNDPAIVLDDADVEAVAYKLFWVAFGNCGQICQAVKRVYVHESLHDDLVEALAELARSVKMGDPTADGTQLGPINNARQYERVKELTQEALDAGATAVAGGRAREGKGYFFEPTILTDVTDDLRVVAEEQFGPVLPVLPYSTVDEAIGRANDGPYGISASVWSPDRERALAVADELDVQSVYLNAHLLGGERVPYGGFKSSGVGVANGLAGLLGYTEPRVISEARTWAGVELPTALQGLEEVGVAP